MHAQLFRFGYMCFLVGVLLLRASNGAQGAAYSVRLRFGKIVLSQRLADYLLISLRVLSLLLEFFSFAFGNRRIFCFVSIANNIMGTISTQCHCRTRDELNNDNKSFCMQHTRLTLLCWHRRYFAIFPNIFFVPSGTFRRDGLAVTCWKHRQPVTTTVDEQISELTTKYFETLFSLSLIFFFLVSPFSVGPFRWWCCSLNSTDMPFYIALVAIAILWRGLCDKLRFFFSSFERRSTHIRINVVPTTLLNCRRLNSPSRNCAA